MEVIEWKKWVATEIKRQRMTLRAISDIAGINHGTLSRLLSSDRVPMYSVVVKVTNALGYSLNIEG